jgi:hypothetical protein
LSQTRRLTRNGPYLARLLAEPGLVASLEADGVVDGVVRLSLELDACRSLYKANARSSRPESRRTSLAPGPSREYGRGV